MRLLSFPSPQIPQSGGISFWKKQPNDPTPNDIPPNNNALWLNTKTGEIFVHIKNCSGKAIWKGQLGTLVVPSTVTKFDIFEDGSAVALYRFEGTANDDGGRYDFEADKTPSFVDGKWGQAINIGNDLHLKIDNFPNFKEITISLWLFLPQRGTGWRNLLHITPDGQNMSGNSRQPAVFLHTNDIRRFHFRNDGVSTRNIGIDVSNAILTPGQWNHVVFIRTSEKLEIYLNSKKTDEYVSNEQFKHNSGTLYLHDTFYGAGFMVDQLRIFNRALTEEEIQILYKEMEEC